MARLRSAATGAIVDVSDETAALLDGFEPVESEKKAPAKKATPSKTDEK